MCVRYFLISLMTLSASYAGDSPNDYGEFVHEGSSLEVKISATLSVLSTEINRRFDAVQEKLSDLQHDMNILKKKNLDLGEKHHDLEGNINVKLNKLENNIIDRLEGYIDGKIDYLGKHIYRKIDAQEITTPKITDIKIIGDKLDVLQMNANLEKQTCKPQKVSNDLMEGMNKEVTKNFNEIQMNISELKNMTPDFDIKSFNKNIIKLQEKIDLLEININNKTDTLRDTIAVINSNDELKNCQTKLNGSIIEKFKLIVDEAQGKAYDKINSKLIVIEDNISEVKNVTKYLKHASLDIKFTNLEDNLKREIIKIIPTIKDNIERKLDELHNKLQPHFEDIKAMEKNILTIKNNIIDVSINKNLQNIEHNSTEMQNNNPEVIQNNNKTTSALENSEKNELTGERAPTVCKSQVASSFVYEQYHRLDDKSLPHVPVSYSAGGLASLEIHLQIKGPEPAYILLSSAPDSTWNVNKTYYIIRIGISSNQKTDVWNPNWTLQDYKNAVLIADTPNILSKNEFTAFYVKINNGSLVFAKDGGSPILQLSSRKLEAIKYFAMTAQKETTILYDCLPAISNVK